MPCRDYDSDSEMREYQKYELQQSLDLNKRLKENLDKHAMLLCEATNIIKDLGALSPVMCSPTLIEWRRKHDNDDLEALKRSALAKLTPEEIQALGLNTKANSR